MKSATCGYTLSGSNIENRGSYVLNLSTLQLRQIFDHWLLFYSATFVQSWMDENTTKNLFLRPWPLSQFPKSLVGMPLYPPPSPTSSQPITGTRSTLMTTDKHGFGSRLKALNKMHWVNFFNIVPCLLPQQDFYCLCELSQTWKTRTSQPIFQ